MNNLETYKVRKKKFNWFIGIDVSKNELDYAIVSGGQMLFHEEHQNNTPAVIGFCEGLKEKIPGFSLKKALFCMEQSGLYCNPSLMAFRKLKVNVVCENALRIKRSLGLVRGKDDKTDAIRIAVYAEKNQLHLKLWQPRRPIIEELMYLNTLRTRISSMSMSVVNRLKEQEKYIGIGLHQKIKKLCKNSDEALKLDFLEINNSIQNLIKGDERLSRLHQIITSVKSVGNVTAIQVILSTNEFRDITCPKKFACYAGVAPFKTESGLMKKKTRVSHVANKKMKALLHICALNALRCDTEMKRYYERKTKTDGKPKMAVVNAIRYKLILRIFACLKQDRLYQLEFHSPRIQTAGESMHLVNSQV
ncbi:MAG TPA: transposase [Mucilaginibacter sp.]|nr:transposase [Mucilaginibacter sp.]